MALAKEGNLIYIDTTASASFADIKKLKGVILTPSGGNAAIVIQGVGSSAPLLNLTATNNDSKHFDFSLTPMLFPRGLKVTTLTNALLTLIVETV